MHVLFHLFCCTFEIIIVERLGNFFHAAAAQIEAETDQGIELVVIELIVGEVSICPSTKIDVQRRRTFTFTFSLTHFTKSWASDLIRVSPSVLVIGASMSLQADVG